LYGNAGINELYGGDGNDQLYSDGGDDVMDGGAGHDMLNLYNGTAVMTGGSGVDVFSGGWSSLGGLTITDFEAGDHLVVSGGVYDMLLSGFDYDDVTGL